MMSTGSVNGRLQAPPDKKNLASPVVRFRAGPFGVIMSGDGLTREEVQEMISLAIEKALPGVFTVALSEAVKGAVSQAMTEYQHKCLLELNAEEICAMQNLVEVIRGTGHGKINEGVEEIRANHNFLSGFRKKAEKAGGALIVTIIASLVGTISVIIGAGIISMTGGGKTP